MEPQYGGGKSHEQCYHANAPWNDNIYLTGNRCKWMCCIRVCKLQFSATFGREYKWSLRYLQQEERSVMRIGNRRHGRRYLSVGTDKPFFALYNDPCIDYDDIYLNGIR